MLRLALVLSVAFAASACGGTALFPPESAPDSSPDAGDAGPCTIVRDPTGICTPTDLVLCQPDAGPPAPLGRGCAAAADYGPGAYCCTPEADAGR